MKNYFRKILATLIATITVFSSAVPVMAADDTNQNYGIETESAKTNVTLDIADSEILVSLPKTVIVSGERDSQDNLYKGHYGVKVEGDYAGNEMVTVVPDTTVELSQTGKASVEADISQDKTQWTYDESETVAEGEISTNKLSAGMWNGTFNFNVSLEKFIPEGYTVLYKYDLSATENDNVAAYYCVPNKNTSPIEVKDEASPITATLKSLFMPMTAYAAEGATVIEANGIRYELSDEDTLIISGQGKMKQNVYQDLVKTEEIKKRVAEHFPNMTEVIWGGWVNLIDVGPIKDRNYNTDNLEYVSYWNTNSIYPNSVNKAQVMRESNGRPYYNCDPQYKDTQMYQEVCDYIDSIKDEYIISMPKKVVINEGISNISNYAFYNCTSLEEITIPNTVTSIDFDALAKTRIKKLNIPNSVTTIADCAFWGNPSLTEVKLSENLKSLGVNAFQQCTALTEIEIPEGITKIGQWTFLDCSSLEKIYIPKAVTLIDTWAFLDCNKLKTIYFGGTKSDFENITVNSQVIGNTSSNPSACISTAKKYYQCSKYGNYKYYVPEDAANECTVYNYSGTKNIVVIPSSMNGKTVNTLENTFAGNTNLEAVTIPNSVKNINGAFEGCNNLTSIIMPSSLETIGSNTFNCAYNLSNVEIPNTVTSIGANCFAGCNMQSIKIPQTVKTIGSNAFADCTKLKTITIPDSVESIGNYAFSGCTSLANVILSNKMTEIPNGCFSECTSLTDMCIPSNVTTIGMFAYRNCTGLTELNFPNNVTSVGTYAFRGCSNISKIVINKNMTWVSTSFFSLNNAEIFIPDMDDEITPSKFGVNSRTGVLQNCTVYLQSDKHYDFYSSQTMFTDETLNNKLIIDSTKF